MTTCMGNSCLCSFVNIYQLMCVCASFPFGSEGGMWDLISS